MRTICQLLALALLTLVHGWEVAKTLKLNYTADDGTQTYMTGLFSSMEPSGELFEREFTSSVKTLERTIEGQTDPETWVEPVVSQYDYDSYENNFNVLSRLETDVEVRCQFIPSGVIRDENVTNSLSYVAACGNDMITYNVVQDEISRLSILNQWDANPGATASDFDFVIGNTLGTKLLFIKGDQYYAQGSPAQQFTSPTTLQSGGSRITTACVSASRYVLGTESRIYVGAFDGTTPIEKLIQLPTSNYSLTCSDQYLRVVYIQVISEMTMINIDTYSFNVLDGTTTPMYDIEDVIDITNFADRASIINCNTSAPATNPEITVNAGISAYTDDISLIISLPLCDVAALEDETGNLTSFSMSVNGFKNIYYTLETEQQPQTYRQENIPELEYTVSYTPSVPSVGAGHHVQLLTQGTFSGQVLILNGLSWRVTEVGGGNNISVTSSASNSPVVVRACDRTTYGYPTCQERSYVPHADPLMPGCPIEYDGYYCDRCGPRYAESNTSPAGPVCDRCASVYFGPRCSANAIGVALLVVVVAILIIGGTMGYVVNRK